LKIRFNLNEDGKAVKAMFGTVDESVFEKFNLI
jgi:hypothetical protein